MKPFLKHRRVVEVPATKTWEATLNHRVYSCPDTYDHVAGATGLILLNRNSEARVPLEVIAVEKIVLDNDAQFEALAEPLRIRVQNYLAEAREIYGIIQPGHTYRFYFLNDEPWPLWLQQLTAKTSNTEWAAIISICNEPERFFEWPQLGELFWPGCTRGDEHQQHEYPPELGARLLRLGLKPDPRNNGPAIMAFLAAGGRRPSWGNEGWPIHHIYDGTGAINGGPAAGTHAVQDGRYFTHSGGLVTAHPVAHDLAHRSTLLKWLLRREALLRFGFDPDQVFQSPAP